MKRTPNPKRQLAGSLALVALYVPLAVTGQLSPWLYIPLGGWAVIASLYWLARIVQGSHARRMRTAHNRLMAIRSYRELWDSESKGSN